MSCNCKETRKVKSCPTISVEETILTELRNFYEYVVAKFTTVLDSLTSITDLLTAEKPALVYDFLNGAVIADNAAKPITTPAKMVSMVLEITGLPTVEDPNAYVELIAPDATVVWEFYENQKLELPVASLRHQDPGLLVGWRLRVVGTFAGPVYPVVSFKLLTIAEA